jgi:hypothetical protein
MFDQCRQILDRGGSWQVRAGVRHELEDRPVRKERRGRDKDDPRLRVPETCEIGNGKGAALIENKVQHDDVAARDPALERGDRGGFSVNRSNGRTLALQMRRPKIRQGGVALHDQHVHSRDWYTCVHHFPIPFAQLLPNPLRND